MIIIVVGDELFKTINHVDYEVSMMIGKCIDWMVTNLERIIRVHKMDLLQAQPGAVSYFEPKVIWMKMFEKNCKEYGILAKKFNVILKQAVKQSQVCFIIKPL